MMTFLELILLVGFLSVMATIITFLFNRRRLPNIGSDEDVLKLAASGKHLQAIKAYRQLHGVSLKDAKRFVDSHSPTERGNHGK